MRRTAFRSRTSRRRVGTEGCAGVRTSARARTVLCGLRVLQRAERRPGEPMRSWRLALELPRASHVEQDKETRAWQKRKSYPSTLPRSVATSSACALKRVRPFRPSGRGLKRLSVYRHLLPDTWISATRAISRSPLQVPTGTARRKASVRSGIRRDMSAYNHDQRRTDEALAPDGSRLSLNGPYTIVCQGEGTRCSAGVAMEILIGLSNTAGSFGVMYHAGSAPSVPLPHPPRRSRAQAQPEWSTLLSSGRGW